MTRASDEPQQRSCLIDDLQFLQFVQREQDCQCEEALFTVVVANPRGMRDLPRLVREVGLELVSGSGVVYTNTGAGGFFATMAEALGTVLARSGLLPPSVVEAWQGHQRRAIEEQTFFGASNYNTYLARRPR